MLAAFSYKVVLLLSLAVAGGSVASIGYYYQARVTDLNNQVSNLNDQNNSQSNQINTLKTQLDNLTRQIDNLTRQIDNLTRQIDKLQVIDFQLVSQIAQLRAQIASNLCASGKTITLGELTDLSSALSTQGVRVKDASLLAINDINSLLTSAGCNLKFAISVNDYALDNIMALTELQAFAASGVQVVVGPLNSGAAQFLLSFADSNHIVLISPSSSSRALAIPNDYLFRTIPNDGVQGLSDARMLVDRGASAAIIVQRHDSYGDNLENATATRFKALGGVVSSVIQYDQATTDFTTVLQTLNTDFQAANSTYPNKVALDFISFEEFGQIIIQAHAQYPKLLNTKLPWFGTDGEAQDTVISGNPTSGPLVAQVRLPSTLWAPVDNPKTLALDSRFASTYPGNFCDSFCLGAYDDVWLAALATLQAGSYDGVKIQAVMLTVAWNYYGVTGWTDLEPSGDRAAVSSSYQIWKVINQGIPSVPTWVLAGTWDGFSDSITWISPP